MSGAVVSHITRSRNTTTLILFFFAGKIGASITVKKYIHGDV